MKPILLLAICLAVNTLAFSQAPTLGLVGYWPMNGNYTDAGPYNITGTNIASTATTNKTGTANAAMAFANPTATVAQYGTHAVNSNLNFSGTQNFTITFSVFINSPVVHPCGLYDNNLNYSGPGLFFWNANGYPQIQFNYKNKSVGTTNGAFAIAVWQHICAVRESGNIKIYINGVLNNTTTESTNNPTYAFTAKFGTMFYNAQSPPNYNGLHGKLDEFRIYNRALTPAEISSMASNALPVNLTSFTVENKNDIANIQWQTEQEQNSSHFDIERSVDAVNFISIGSVGAAGNSSTTNNYIYIDKTLHAIQNNNKIFYRLKSVDIDGKFTYSKIVIILLVKMSDEVFVFPNPAKEDLNVQAICLKDSKATLQILDAAGKVVLQKEINIWKGRNNFQVNISKLKCGTYHLKLIENDEWHKKTFLKIE